MRSILLTLWFALLGLVLIPPSVPAADPINSKPIDWKPIPIGGLNVSLTTSGYRFPQASVGAETSSNERIILPEPGGRTFFVASVCLSNRSRSAIPFSFNDAGPLWTFRIVNSDDHEVWRSNADIASPQVITEDVLAPGKSWKMSARIPLVIEDVPLVVGAYTLQAFLNADKSVSATSTFEIVPIPGQDTGISGLVLREVLAGSVETGAIVEVPAPGVRVQVTEIITSSIPTPRLPFTWSGITNSEGKFTVYTPPGRFRVTAYEPMVNTTTDQNTAVNNLQIGTIIIFPGFPRASAEVTVQDGAFSDLTLHFRLTTPPAITQGIKGTVRMGSIDPILTTFSGTLTTLGDVSTTILLPLFVYEVRVAQIDAPSGTVPFEWTGRADLLGNFQVATPPGKFNVFGSRLLAPGVYTFVAIEPATDMETVTVEPNTVATVSLVLEESGLVVNLPE